MLTQERLKEVLCYDPDSGIFVWLENRGSVIFGTVAGYCSSQGYRRIAIDGKRYLAHRLAWVYQFSEFPTNQIDHINHIRDDNRICNLRPATNQDNGRNQTRRITSVSGHVGVRWHKTAKKWQARITVNRREIYLGIFIDKADAVIAREQAEKDHGFHKNHGDKNDTKKVYNHR